MGGSNRMMDPGSVSVSAPYFISARTGVLTGITAGQPVVRLAQLGMIDPRLSGGALQPTPIQISQIRLRYAPRTSPATGCIFEVFKGVGTPATTGGNAHTAQRRKTTGYPPVTLAETHLYAATTGAISGGAFAPDDATGPLDWVAVGIVDVGVGNGVWMPSDLCPTQLEAGEALEVRAAVDMSGTGILLSVFDFLR